MSEENKVQETNVKEELANVKTALAEAKSAFRIWKKENKVRNLDKVKDEKLIAEFKAHEEKIQALVDQKEALIAESKKGKRKGFEGSYKYGTYTNEAGEEVQVISKSKDGKRWRNHARKLAKKLGIKPQEVEWDPTFFLPKPKAEKKAKKEAKAEEATPETPVKTPRKKKAKKA